MLHDLIIFAFASNTVWQRVNGIKRTRSLVELVFAAATSHLQSLLYSAFISVSHYLRHGIDPLKN